MRDAKTLCSIIALAFSILAQNVYADATKTVGASGADYATLKLAFDAVNAGSVTGAITLQVIDNTTETASAVLNASGSGSASYTSVTIYPTVAGKTISGALAAPLVDFNGADNVTIDGRVNQAGSADLTISNTNTGSTATSTIRFIADARTNTIRYCTLKGSGRSVDLGTVFFSTGTTTGNDGNTITNCTITSAGANLPYNAIRSLGTSDAIANSGCSVTNNSIQDYFTANNESNGVYATYSSSWTITGNKFFQTASRTAGAYKARAVYIFTTTGSGFTVNNNTIGYSSAAGTGTTTYTGVGANTFTGIDIRSAASPASDVQGNTITAISITTAATGGAFSGISVSGGGVDVGTSAGNVIGAGTGTRAIVVTATASTPTVYGIYSSSSATVTISNNTIGSIAVDGAADIGATFCGISVTAFSSNYVITGNTIGSTTTSNSITIGVNGVTTTGVCTFYGIKHAGVGGTTITSNTIQNCSAYGTGASVYWGIHNIESNGTTSIATNTIQNGFSQGTGKLGGIYNATNSSTLNINANTIGTLTCATADTALGIYNAGSSVSVNIFSNAINTITATGASSAIAGIRSVVATTTGNFYSNTIHALSGSGTTSPSVTGINIGGGQTCYVYKNNIYDLSETGAIATASGAVNGIEFSGGSFIYAYNNFISELKAPSANLADALRGISVTSTTASTYYYAYYNTIYLDGTSIGANFGSSGVYHTASSSTYTAWLDLRNNMIINMSTPVGSGLSVAFRRSSGAASMLANYSSQSDYNDFYAGTPGASHLIYYDGTTAVQLVTDYKCGIFTAGTVAARDAHSITDLPPFINTSVSPYDLRVDPTGCTLCEGRGVVISSPAITTDFYGTARYPNSGYPVNGSYPPSAPDIGAQEFAGMKLAGISGTFNVGVGETYTSLTNALGLFEAISNAGLSGDFTALITSDITETGNVALSSWTGSNTLTIRPSGGAPRTLSGTFNGPLLSLDGADNVTIDGLNSGGNSLTITNASTGASAITIKIANDASGNTVRNCTIKGSGTGSLVGVIYIYGASGGTTGCDNNTIDHNTITCAADANRPGFGVTNEGTSGAVNNGNTISNNNFVDIMSRTTTTVSCGVYVRDYATGETITGNSMYESASIAPSGTGTYLGIYVASGTGDGFTITNNSIGGSAPQCGGSPWTKTVSNNNPFYGIYLAALATNPCSIQGNTIQNFAYANSGSGGWMGIYVSAGDMNIGTVAGNTIGAATGTGSIAYAAGATGAAFYGINITTAGTTDCRNNIIGSITLDNSAATPGATNFFGISKTLAGTTTINANTIGSTITANSINLLSVSSAAAQTAYGIKSSGTTTAVVSANTVSNITNGTANTTAGTAGLINGIYMSSASSGTVTGTNNTVRDLTIANANTLATYQASIAGIMFYNTASIPVTITGNAISNLSNTYASFAGHVFGIIYHGSATVGTVSGNFVTGLSADASSTQASLTGMRANAGSATYSNNIVSLGGATQSTLYGIYETGAGSTANTLYFNTISIAGVPTSGALNSYALYSAVTSNTRVFKNNIFSNTRSNAGASGTHYAEYFATAANGTGLTNDYNDYYASGSGGVVGYFAAANRLTLASLQTATSQDVHSLNLLPGFVSASGTTVADYTPTVTLTGVAGTGIATDYTGAARTGVTMGALNGVSCTWTGALNTAWDDASNWIGGVPQTGSDVVIATGAPIMPVTGTAATLGSLTMQSGTTLALGADMQVDNTLTLSNGLITLGSYNFTLGSAATIAGTPSAANMIVATGSGELRKVFTDIGSFTYPVGDNTGTPEYSPVTLTFTSGTFASAYAGMNLVNAKHAGNTSTTDYLNRSWTVTQSGITGFSCDLTLQYVPADIAGTEANIYGGVWDGATWTLGYQADAMSHTLAGTVPSFSTYSGGEQGVLPVELSSFTSMVDARNVILKWGTATEKNNYGFEVERRCVSITSGGAACKATAWNASAGGPGVFTKIGFVEGSGTSNAPKAYSFSDRNIPAGTYSYRLKQIGRDGTFEYSKEVEVSVSAPAVFALSQNYPNPFNPTTTIVFTVPVSGRVELKVFNTIGQEVALLFDGEAQAGIYNQVQFDASGLSSGIYFSRLEYNGNVQLKKMTLLK